MTRRLSDMTPEQRAAYDRYHAAQRKTDMPMPRLEHDDRVAMAYMGHLDLWSKAAVGRVFGVHRTAVSKAMASFPRLP